MTNDFAPTASFANLSLRAELLKRLRLFFDQRGFLEVETPLLSHDTVIDRHIDPMGIELNSQKMWLQTSPRLQTVALAGSLESVST